MMPRCFLLLIVAIFSLLFFAYEGTAQGTHDEEDHHKHEVGVANSAVYFFSEKTLNYGMHLHYTFHILHTRFGVGAGYEKIFDRHGHNSIGLNFMFKPLENMHLNLSPAMAFESKGDTDLYFALHFEVSYEFRFDHWHIGPTAAVGYNPEDVHLGLGIHLGYGF